MMPVRWMTCMLVLFLSCFGTHTQEGHTHVVWYGDDHERRPAGREQ
jgi:hypothetical protein